MTDSTAELEMYAAIDRFLAGEYSPTSLQSWLLNDFILPEGADEDHPAMRLWILAVTNVAVYTHCDMERSVLESSLRLIVRSMQLTGLGCTTPITDSRCFAEMKRSGRVPYPLRWSTS